MQNALVSYSSIYWYACCPFLYVYALIHKYVCLQVIHTWIAQWLSTPIRTKQSMTVLQYLHLVNLVTSVAWYCKFTQHVYIYIYMCVCINNTITSIFFSRDRRITKWIQPLVLTPLHASMDVLLLRHILVNISLKVSYNIFRERSEINTYIFLLVACHISTIYIYITC